MRDAIPFGDRVRGAATRFVRAGSEAELDPFRRQRHRLGPAGRLAGGVMDRVPAAPEQAAAETMDLHRDPAPLAVLPDDEAMRRRRRGRDLGEGELKGSGHGLSWVRAIRCEDRAGNLGRSA
ncbi:hypothetical protein AIGOOFII_2616 [Methylobacterium marchantiae]|nr:hypothetical protein AIGOOFII_2616 [Methylobacterium marchantiae]